MLVLHTLLLFVLIAISVVADAEIAYEFRTPKGATIYTDVKLKPPFEFVRVIKLPAQKKQASSNYMAYVKKKQNQYDTIVRRMASKYKLQPQLVHAIIEAESAYKPDAVSSAGAIGMMQLMPATAEKYEVSDPTNVVENIEGGCQHMRFLLDLHDQDLSLAIASYNAGENAVKRYNNSIPPYPETIAYVEKVLQFYQRNTN
jgi:soluble lytic murein transglycosylase-like protein